MLRERTPSSGTSFCPCTTRLRMFILLILLNAVLQFPVHSFLSILRLCVCRITTLTKCQLVKGGYEKEITTLSLKAEQIHNFDVENQTELIRTTCTIFIQTASDSNISNDMYVVLIITPATHPWYYTQTDTLGFSDFGYFLVECLRLNFSPALGSYLLS